MTGRDHPAHPAALLAPRRLHRHPQPAAATIIGSDVDHAQTGQPHQQIAAITVDLGTRAATSAARRLIPSSGSRNGFLVVLDPEDLDPHITACFRFGGNEFRRSTLRGLLDHDHRHIGV
jgi:hypothetical protein